jgi:uncharacterized protein YbbK (DUF523 family)/uncharacterized protein YbgA (DUF1722 family)
LYRIISRSKLTAVLGRTPEGFRVMRKFTKPVVVISRCLGLDACRYDGDMVEFPFARQLKPWVTLVPVCPEMEIGLGVPRDKIVLVRQPRGRQSLHQPATGKNLTRRMAQFSGRFASRLTPGRESCTPKCDGFILKSKSPSCGLGTTKLFDKASLSARVIGHTSGVFAAEIESKLPDTAVIDEHLLSDERKREHWLTKLFALAEFRAVAKSPGGPSLSRYHRYYRSLLQVYSAKQTRMLDEIIAASKPSSARAAFQQYGEHLRLALRRPPQKATIARVYESALEHYAPHLTDTDQRIFRRMLHQYRQGKLPLSAVRRTVQIWAVRYDKRFVRQHALYRPYPGELARMEEP